MKVALTGATRHRVQTRLFRSPLIVLQVELHSKGYCVDDSYGSGRDVDYTWWRDATLEDISKVAPK